jgi:hypothetical protein
MLVMEVHRHPAVTAILDVRGKTVASTLSPVTENENRRSILGYKQRGMPA